jgi:hypothetical protein
VTWLVGDLLLLRDFGPNDVIFMNVFCYNRCDGSTIKGFCALLLSSCWMVGDHLVFSDVWPYGIMSRYVCVTVALVILIRDFRPYGIIFMTVCCLCCHNNTLKGF